MAAPVVEGSPVRFFFSVAVFAWLAHGFHSIDAEKVSMSVSEGDSVTLLTGIKTQEDRIRWYFNNTRIAQIFSDPSKTCTDVQCNEDTERFRDRLKVDHQTGSLTITDTRTTDSGLYELKISGSSDEKTFRVSVHAVSGSGLSAGEIAGIAAAAAVVLLAAAAAVISSCCRISGNGQEG